MNRTPDTWIADGYDVKQRGGRMIAYCGPHHTPAHEYPVSCRLQDEENARWIAAAPARISALEDALRSVLDWSPVPPDHWRAKEKDAFIADMVKARDVLPNDKLIDSHANKL